MTDLTPAQIAGVAQQAGFSGNDLTTAVAVALAESGGNPNATHSNTNGSIDYGLWQINSVHSSLLQSGTWSTPSDNARMAYSVWQGSGWKAWTTYTSGAYLTNMGRAALASGSPDLSASTGASGASTASNPLSDLGSVGNAITWLSTAANWERIAEILAGCFAIFLALGMIERRTGVVSHAVGKVGGAALLA
jgi:hypothetical protein